MPAVLVWYDPALCVTPEGMINCDSDPTHVADGTKVTEELYGKIAACDKRLLGATVTFRGIGTFRCRDTGGMIRPMWSRYYGRWVLYFDVMLHENPPWNYWLIEDWSVKW